MPPKRGRPRGRPPGRGRQPGRQQREAPRPDSFAYGMEPEKERDETASLPTVPPGEPDFRIFDQRFHRAAPLEDYFDVDSSEFYTKGEWYHYEDNQNSDGYRAAKRRLQGVYPGIENDDDIEERVEDYKRRHLPAPESVPVSEAKRKIEDDDDIEERGDDVKRRKTQASDPVAESEATADAAMADASHLPAASDGSSLSSLSPVPDTDDEVDDAQDDGDADGDGDVEMAEAGSDVANENEQPRRRLRASNNSATAPANTNTTTQQLPIRVKKQRQKQTWPKLLSRTAARTKTLGNEVFAFRVVGPPRTGNFRSDKPYKYDNIETWWEAVLELEETHTIAKQVQLEAYRVQGFDELGAKYVLLDLDGEPINKSDSVHAELQQLVTKYEYEFEGEGFDEFAVKAAQKKQKGRPAKNRQATEVDSEDDAGQPETDTKLESTKFLRFMAERKKLLKERAREKRRAQRAAQAPTNAGGNARAEPTRKLTIAERKARLDATYFHEETLRNGGILFKENKRSQT